MFVGAGDEPCVVVMTGARVQPEQLLYPKSELAARYGASAEETTPDPKQAYAPYERATRGRPETGTAFRGPSAVLAVTRFVVDCDTLLRIAAGEIEVAPEHKLVAPTLVRSQALTALYEAARRGEITAAEGMERVTKINSLKVRFLGDKVLQRTAWRVADQLGWETTSDAEFVALTQLQADAFVTSDDNLARAVSGLVETATIDALRQPARR